jgi:hypothetical protein
MLRWVTNFQHLLQWEPEAALGTCACPFHEKTLPYLTFFLIEYLAKSMYYQIGRKIIRIHIPKVEISGNTSVFSIEVSGHCELEAIQTTGPGRVSKFHIIILRDFCFAKCRVRAENHNIGSLLQLIF